MVSDFLEERRCILENVGPDLQNMYDSTGLEVSDGVIVFITRNLAGKIYFDKTEQFDYKLKYNRINHVIQISVFWFSSLFELVMLRGAVLSHTTTTTA